MLLRLKPVEIANLVRTHNPSVPIQRVLVTEIVFAAEATLDSELVTTFQIITVGEAYDNATVSKACELIEGRVRLIEMLQNIIGCNNIEFPGKLHYCKVANVPHVIANCEQIASKVVDLSWDRFAQDPIPTTDVQ